MQNRVGRRSYKFHSPYYRLHGKDPLMQQCHPFGCKAYVQDVNPNSPKLAPTSNQAIFLGYADDSDPIQVYLDHAVRQSKYVHFIPDPIASVPTSDPIIDSSIHVSPSTSIAPESSRPVRESHKDTIEKIKDSVSPSRRGLSVEAQKVDF